MHEQARLSNLVFPDTSKDEVPQWNSGSWPPLLGGWRCSHASVIVNGEKKEQQTIVVIGGATAKGATNSVLLMALDKDTKQWRDGPCLNHNRACHAAVVCNGSVYAMGGGSKEHRLDSIERIDLVALLKSPCTTNNTNPWRTLTCTLSTPRGGCQAAAVNNRFIVIVGGYNGSFLSSTDILDTAVQTQHIVTPGPSLTIPRSSCGMAVVGNRIIVIGGHNESRALNSVEYLDFIDTSQETNEDVGFIFPSSSKWKVHKDLVLSVPRTQHAVGKVGSCLIVTGGKTKKALKLVEVLDTKRNAVFNIPDMTTRRNGPSLVSLSDMIAVIGGFRQDTCETLALSDTLEHTQVRRLLQKELVVISQGTGEIIVSNIVALFSYDTLVLFFSKTSQNMYSCRAELDMELEKLKSKIQLANRDRINVKALQEAIEAESLLSLLEGLRDQDDKFRSVHELQETIDELKGKLQNMDSLAGCLPIARKIEELQRLVDLNGSYGDGKNVAGQKAKDEFEFVSVTGNEILPVSGRSSDEDSNACFNLEERLMKLEDMMVQLSDRVGLLENPMLSKKT